MDPVADTIAGVATLIALASFGYAIFSGRKADAATAAATSARVDSAAAAIRAADALEESNRLFAESVKPKFWEARVVSRKQFFLDNVTSEVATSTELEAVSAHAVQAFSVYGKVDWQTVRPGQSVDCRWSEEFAEDVLVVNIRWHRPGGEQCTETHRIERKPGKGYVSF